MKSTLIVIFLGFSTLSNAQTDSTIFAATAFTEFSGKKNVVYCASLELLWLELTDYLGNQPKAITRVEDLENLNHATAEYHIPLNEAFWFAKVGLEKDGIIDSIQSAYQQQFGLTWKPDSDNESTDLIGHAYLKKTIDFYSSQDQQSGHFRFNDSIRVKCFMDNGMAGPKNENWFQIHDFKNDDDFIFQMGCKDSLDEVYFAKVPPQENLKTTYEAIMDRVNANRLTCLGVYDEFLIPYLKFDVTNDFEQLQNLVLTNGSEIKKLSQQINFDLNKDGIKLESQANSVIILGVDEEPEPKIYAFDQPFLIILKRKGALTPYFLMWVQNAQFMETNK